MASEAVVDRNAMAADRPDRQGPSGNRVGSETGTSAGDGKPDGRPSRWKLALLTWLGAYAVILLVLGVAGPAIADWPVALRALLLSAVMVAAMTWVIVPMIMLLFRSWLQR
jgi:antibiotic biosynthesis monooxygenase (ABM) superfamily enzyme